MSGWATRRPGPTRSSRSAGSPAIAGLRVSRGYATPTVDATLGGTRPPADAALPGQRQRAGDLDRVRRTRPGRAMSRSAPPRARRGSCASPRATGPGGRRRIYAEATRGGLPFTSPEVAHYTAPAIPRPGAVGHLRASRTRGTLSVRFTGAPGAKTYTVKILLSDGRGLQRTLRPPSTASRSRTWEERPREVTVTPVGPDGRRGPPRRTRLG